MAVFFPTLQMISPVVWVSFNTICFVYCTVCHLIGSYLQNSTFIRDIRIDFCWSKTRSVIQSSRGSRFPATFQYFIVTVASCLEMKWISVLVFWTTVCDWMWILCTVCQASWKIQTWGKIVNSIHYLLLIVFFIALSFLQKF